MSDMMRFSVALPAVVSVGLSIILSGCGSGGTTSTTTTTTTVLDPHVKWWKKQGYNQDGGAGLSVGADGTVFFFGVDGLNALDGDDGALKWQFDLKNYSVGRPVVGLDGSLYVLTTDAPFSEGSVVAVNGNGTRKWIQDFNESKGLCQAIQIVSARNSVALGSEGTVFVSRCHAEGAPSLFALDGDNGTIKWQTSIGNHWQPSPVVAPDNTVFLTDLYDNVFAVRGTDGSLKWNVSIRGTSSPPTLGANGSVLVCSTDDGLFALDGKDGSVKWHQLAACSERYSSFGAAVGSDGTVFVQSPCNYSSAIEETNLLALNGDDGSIKWSHKVSHPGEESFTKAAVSADGTVYVGLGMSVYAFDADSGDMRWKSTSNEFELTVRNLPPVIGLDGTVFLLSSSSLFAYYSEGGPATATTPSGYAQGLYLV